MTQTVWQPSEDGNAGESVLTDPDTTVQIGRSFDGLPLLLAIRRMPRIDSLTRAVLRSFDVTDVTELPTRVRLVLESDMAQALMAVHTIDVATGAPAPAYVSASSTRSLLGPTLMQTLMDPAPNLPTQTYGYEPPKTDLSPITAVSPHGFAAAVQAAIEHAKSSRRLLVTADNGVWIGTVHDSDKGLRSPVGPYRRAIFESLAGITAATAVVRAPGRQPVSVATSDHTNYVSVLRAMEPADLRIEYQVPVVALLDQLADVAEELGKLHRKGLAHTDVNPSNILLAREGAQLIDSLDVPFGDLSAAATFEWAAPEQILTRPVDARTDVYAIGRIATALLRGVVYGPSSTYVVPTGGAESRTVTIVTADGVYLDQDLNEFDTAQQRRWQDALSGMVSYDKTHRPADGTEAARILRELTTHHPPATTLTMNPPPPQPFSHQNHTDHARIIFDT